MVIWFLLLVPVLATVLMFIFFDKSKIAWWEYILLFVSSVFVISISKLIIETSMTSDTEYWGETAYKVEYEGKYDEYIYQTCTEEYACGTNSDGNTKYCTRTYDCSYVEHYGPKWRIKSESGSSIRINQSEYNRIKNKWGNEKKTGSHSESYSYDDGIYSSFWLSRRELIECIVTKHTYENRVQATHTIFDFQEVTEDDKNKYHLYDYPEIYDGYKQRSILGAKDVQAEKNMQILNAELGPKKQLKVFILLFKNQSEQAGIMQEAYWQGGNKNEFVLAIGVDINNNVTWAHPFSWAEHSSVKVNAKSFVMNQNKLDLVAISNFLYDDLNENFVRKQFSEFNYITVEPSTSSIIWSMIIVIIINTGLVFWFHSNEFDDELMNKSISRKRRGRSLYK